MKAERVTGLVSAGGITHLFLSRMPALLRALGPVKAASFRVARRIVNSLRAGYAIEDYLALKPCQLIWIAVPDAALDRVLQDLNRESPLERTMVVLCGSARDSRWTGALCGARARVGSLNVIEETGERAFIAEGHPDVIRELSRLMAAEKRKLIEIRPGSKALYFAGVHLSTDLLLPWIAAAVESLRGAGFSRIEATRVVETMGIRSLRAYGKAGRRAWSPSAARALRRAIEHDVEDIHSAGHRLAALYTDGIEQAIRYFEAGER
jgi:hypothetical protein